MSILPEPLPGPGVPRLPRGVRDRLEFFEWLWQAIELDALATVDELRRSGWSEDAIADAIVHYRAWLTGNIADAVELARVAGGVAA